MFGAVGPEDLVRGYLVLFAVAFGMGAVGLFMSALTKRTQTATVLTSAGPGADGGHGCTAPVLVGRPRRPSADSLVVTTRPFNAPEALLYLNPFAADADLVCTTAPGPDHLCEYVGR